MIKLIFQLILLPFKLVMLPFKAIRTGITVATCLLPLAVVVAVAGAVLWFLFIR